MNIFFDIEESMSSEDREAFFLSNQGFVLTQVKELIERRLSHLKNDIEWQDGSILILVSLPEKFRIESKNITPDLAKRIMKSITDRDRAHIIEIIWPELRP